ncbi:MAG: aromatic ring-hydroxylating dioxygenase subunit alpha [Actinobacteria bacterium]|jgi:phenylpropionate dioxygenase-like ring-hydroxylating dioxygenase large terminal subunit|nr:aromatic ring-hydroxylating dioxygenase subunit alpha [Actinomycetota bacterium]
MVHVPTRGSLPARLGPQIDNVPDYGPTTMSRNPYTDPVQYELEREHVLAKHWILAGRSEQVVAPGDWISFEGHGETIVITRQPDGSLAAFHNVCQHRGPAIVTDLSGCGARRFTCPYHGWVYDTTGKLVGVPEREDFSDEHLKDVRAKQVAAGEWGGWVWINLLGPDDAPSLIESIGPEISSDLGAYKMEDMILYEVVEWDVPVSYKAIVDGFNEIYHVAQLHHSPPEFVKACRKASFHFVGDNYMCFVPRPENMDKWDESYDHHKNAICHYTVFPNTVFNCNPEHIQVFNPIPLGVDHTRFLCWQLIYPGDMNDPEYAAYFTKMQKHWDGLKVVVGEDIAIYDQLARTKKSSGYTEHILSERECKIHRYHETMALKIRGKG